VVVDAQVRQVPLSHLKTAYAQNVALQRKQVVLKPAVDLLEKNQVPAEMVMPFLKLGIQTAYTQQRGQGFPPGPGGTPATPAYDGPFKDSETDARIKENDPDLWDSSWRNWNRSKPAEPAMQHTQQTHRAPQQGPTPEQQKVYEDLIGKIKKWAGGSYNDYFKPDDQGNSDRLNAFIEHIGAYYGGLSPEMLTETQLGSCMASFDSNYVQSFLAAQAEEKVKRLQSDARQMHSESGSVRQVPTQIDEELQDMLDVI
jgi:hypothetical protein